MLLSTVCPKVPERRETHAQSETHGDKISESCVGVGRWSVGVCLCQGLCVYYFLSLSEISNWVGRMGEHAMYFSCEFVCWCVFVCVSLHTDCILMVFVKEKSRTVFHSPECSLN